MSKNKKVASIASLPLGILDYELFTSPQPVQVSSTQKSQNVIINSSVTAATAIYCNKIILGIPKGTDASSLTNVQPNATVNTTKWTLASSNVQIGTDLGLASSQPYWTFTFQTVSPSDNKIDYELIFTISATVNEQVGSFSNGIIEYSGTSSNPTTFSKKQRNFPITKTVQQFYLENFAATAPAAPTVPVTQFANGDDIRFSWESSGNYFQIYEKGSATPIYEGAASNFLMKGGTDVDSTFFLVASASGKSGGGFESIQLYDALTITISNPDLTPKSVTSSGNISTQGNLTADGVITSNGLAASGPISLSRAGTGGGVLVVSNNPNDNKIYLEGFSSDQKGSADGMYLQGKQGASLSELKISANTTSLSDALKVGGIATLSNALNVTGQTQLSGGLAATAGTVSLMGDAKKISTGTYTATTDGFVLGEVTWYDNSNFTKLCVTAIFGSSGGANAVAMGGTVAALNSGGSSYYASNAGSFLLPVKKGGSCALRIQNAKDNEINAPTAFYWVPLGAGTVGSSLIKISDNVSAEHVEHFGNVRTRHNTEQPGNTIHKLIELIEKIVGKEIDKELKEELALTITRL